MSDVNRSLVAAVATAVATAGTLMMIPTPAQAQPPCKEWHFPPGFALNQTDGFKIDIPTSGASVGPGQATYFKPGIQPSVGPPSGGINGKQITITIPWSNSSLGHFNGFINPDGSASGSSESSSGFRAQWSANKPMVCADVKTPVSDPKPKAPPPPQPPAPPDQKPPEPAPPPGQQQPCVNPLNLPFLPPC
jgi:hypothetical protein